MLEADERAGSDVLGAPVISSGGWDGIGVDGVWVVHLDGILSSREASEGGNAEDESRTHGEGSNGDGGVGGCGVTSCVVRGRSKRRGLQRVKYGQRQTANGANAAGTDGTD
ncbi:hypothetical protein JQN64_26895, partial [Escherichia coli]|nr:hypothetical protein [Escherichia coli]